MPTTGVRPSNMQPPYASVPLETNLARKGLLALGHASGPIDSTDILGIVRSSFPLRPIDLDVVAWLSLRLERDSASVDFSRDALATDLFGRRPGGRDREMVDASFARLTGVRMTLGGFDASAREHRPDGAFVDVAVLESVERVASPAAWRAHFPPWLVGQLEHGYVTYLHWDTLRELRGLAKRLWIYFEAESQDRFYVSLGQRGLSSLCVRTERQADARKAIRSALREMSSIGCLFKAHVTQTRVGDRLRVTRYSEGFRRQLRLEQAPSLSTPRLAVRDDVPSPSRRLVGSRAPIYDRRDPDLADRHGRQQLPEPFVLLQVGTLPDDLAGLLDWIERDALPSNAVILRDGDHTVHAADCTALLDRLTGEAVDGEFVMAASAAVAAAWCRQERLPDPQRCGDC